MKVKLDDVLEAFELSSEEGRYFYSVKTEEVVYVTTDDLGMAEDGDIPDNLPDWEMEMFETAVDIVDNWEDYIELPTQFDIDEYNIMEEFCYSVENKTISNKLSDAIRGSGAFRRFKDSIQNFGIEKQWYAIRDKTFHDMAVEWCERNGIVPVE